jgi:hypothetical protein
MAAVAAMMRGLWETVVSVIIALVLINALVDLIEPSAPLLVPALVIVLAARYFYNRSRRW